jgi:hypothetical protein
LYLHFHLEKDHIWAVAKVMVFRLFFGMGFAMILWFVLPHDSEIRGVAVMIALCPISTMAGAVIVVLVIVTIHTSHHITLYNGMLNTDSK